MAIEIKELQIKVLVDPPQDGNDPVYKDTIEKEGMDKDMIIAVCVEQVLQIIKDKAGR